MKILNHTDIDLHIYDAIIKPNEEFNTVETIFDTKKIHSDMGSIKITTEYSKRFFKCHGKIKAKETKEKDDQGLSVIEVRRKK